MALSCGPRHSVRTLLALLAILAIPASAHALPGFYVAKNAAPRAAHETHVVLMRSGDASVVTVMPDYDGPLDMFALVLAVPNDVELEHVRTLKREFVDRIDQLTAPRFHEWWEQDPCEPAEPEQEWERSLKADPDSAFLGGGPVAKAEQVKEARELFVNVKSDVKQGEYKFSLVRAGQSLTNTLRGRGYVLSDAAASASEAYTKAGMSWLVAEVDAKRVELTGSSRAQLSPIRYESASPIDKLPVRLGLLSANGMQELFVYVLHPDKRYEAKNYPNVLPPTNLEVEMVVKERMGEFYAGLHDLLLHKNPEGVLSEFAWQSQGCGEPCPNAPLQVSELLSLGGDAFEALLPKETREPVPASLSEDEKKAEQAELAALPPGERNARKKQLAEERSIVLRNRGILERQKYVVSRLHHRYDKSSLPNDIELAPATPIRGGIGIPKGANGELPRDVTPASENRFQVRFSAFHPWIGQQQCQNAVRYRWGKAPRTYRGLRKIWIAEDLSRKNRKQIDPAKVIKTAVPALGLNGTPARPAELGPDAESAPPSEPAKSSGSKCACQLPGVNGAGSSDGALLAGVLTALCLAHHRRR